MNITVSATPIISGGVCTGFTVNWTNNNSYDLVTLKRNGSTVTSWTEGDPHCAIGARSYDDNSISVDVSYTYSIEGDSDSGTASAVHGHDNSAPTIGTASRSGSTISSGWTNNGSTGDSQEVYRNEDGGSFYWLATKSGSATGHDDSTGSAGHTYKYKVRKYIGDSGYGYSDFSAESNGVYMPNIYTDDYTDEMGILERDYTDKCEFLDDENVAAGTASVMGLTDSYTDNATYNDSYTDTMGLEETNSSAVSLKTDFANYWGDSSGYIYESATGLYDDESAPISSSWRSKTLDFIEEGLENTGRYKCLRRIDYIYRDWGAVDVVISVSTNGGDTWTSVTKECGIYNDGRTSHQHFDFIKTGQFFDLKVEWPSATADFQFLGLDVVYDEGGEKI